MATTNQPRRRVLKIEGMDEISITELLAKYMDQKPKQFDDRMERQYPVSAIIEMIRELKQDNWIKVSERLPESDGDYLVTLKNEAVFILCFSEEFTDNWLFAHDPTWRNNGINPVTHWQPLPNAPKD